MLHGILRLSSCLQRQCIHTTVIPGCESSALIKANQSGFLFMRILVFMIMYGIAALVDFNLDAAYGHQAMLILGWSAHTASLSCADMV